MNLEKRSAYINELVNDFYAEFLVSCLLEDGVGQNNILADFDGQLKRKWSKDINSTEVETFENGDEVLTIHLNRAGIYDSLPEALFHSFSDKKNATGEEMAKESMTLKAEEKEARLFFRPFENEFFFQNVQLAAKESQVFHSLYSDIMNGLIPDFWKYDQRIPSKYALKLIKLLPFTHKIIGNFELTKQSLEFILGEKVSVEFRNEEMEGIEPEFKQVNGILGECSLGDDSILGIKIEGFIGRLIFQIGPIENINPKDFFNNGPISHLLNCFYSYFTPMEFDVETEMLLNEGQNKFVLDSNPESLNSFLGYNSVL